MAVVALGAVLVAAAAVALVRPALVRASRLPAMSCTAAAVSYALNGRPWVPPKGALSSAGRVSAVGAIRCGKVLYVPLAFLYDAVRSLGGSLQPQPGPPKTLAISGGDFASGPTPGGVGVVGQVVTVTAVAAGEVRVRLSNGGPLQTLGQGDTWALRPTPPCSWCKAYIGHDIIMVGDPQSNAAVELLGDRQGEMVVCRPVRDLTPG